MTSIDWPSLLENWESRVRSGQVDTLRAEVSDLNFKIIPDQYRYDLARICRRVGLNQECLRILATVVLSDLKSATNDQVIEYCMGLIRIGVLEEAGRRLDEIDDQENSALYFCRLLHSVSQWDYQRGKEAVARYLELEKDFYRNTIGQVNYLATLVALEEIETALGLIPKLEKRCVDNQWIRLASNVSELKAQVYLLSGDLNRAQVAIDEAKARAVSQNLTDFLFIEKWQACLEAKKNGNPGPIDRVRRKAILKNHWETVRSLDHQRLRIEYDPGRLNYVYHGSPYQLFKQKLNEEFEGVQQKMVIPEVATHLLDLTNGYYNSSTQLAFQSQTFRCLRVLTGDLYRPIRVGTLYSQLFPGDYYNPYSGPNRVHQTLFRTRQWLADNHISLEVLEYGKAYKVHIRGGLGLVIGDVTEVSFVEKIRQKMKGRKFNVRDAQKLIGKSLSGTRAQLTQACEKGLLLKSGQGKSTQYQLAV